MKRISMLLAATGLLAGVLAVPAHSTIREKITIVDEPYSFGYDCGFPVEVAGVVTNAILIREGKNRIDTTFPVLNRITFSETHTNLDTGEWFTIRGHSTFNEVQVTRIEGTVFSFRAVEAGQPFLVYDSDGNLVARNRGSVHVTYLFDTQGDDVPGGIFVGDVGEQVNGPHPSFDSDPCEIASELVG